MELTEPAPTRDEAIYLVSPVKREKPAIVVYSAGLEAESQEKLVASIPRFEKKDQFGHEWKFVYFTDEPTKYTSDVWIIQEPSVPAKDASVSKTMTDERFKAKYLKLNPHIVLAPYVEREKPYISVWLDPCWELSDVDKFYSEVLGPKVEEMDTAVFLLKHNFSQTYAAESERVKKQEKTGWEGCEKQVEFYNAKLTEDQQKAPMFNGSLIVCQPKQFAPLFETWWQQNILFSSRDEISLPYAAIKTTTQLKELLEGKTFADLNEAEHGIKYGGSRNQANFDGLGIQK